MIQDFSTSIRQHSRDRIVLVLEPLAFSYVGRGAARRKGSLEKTHSRKNSVSGSCVEASVVEALCGAARMEAS